MSFIRPTKLELAVHEAGHAYAFAALLKYQEPQELAIAIDEQGNRHGWCRRATVLLLEVKYATVPLESRPALEWQAEVETAIAIAGPLAESRHSLRGRWNAAFFILNNAEFFLRPEALDTDGDFQRIRDSLAHVAAPDPLATLKRMIDVADGILDTNWPNVRRLSRLLLEKERLGEEELEDWFAAHPAKHHHHPLRPV